MFDPGDFANAFRVTTEAVQLTTAWQLVIAADPRRISLVIHPSANSIRLWFGDGPGLLSDGVEAGTPGIPLLLNFFQHGGLAQCKIFCNDPAGVGRLTFVTCEFDPGLIAKRN
jgi:hypothetical protein